MFLRRAYAFIKRDFLIDTSYRLFFFFNLSGIVLTVLTFFFISRTFGYKVSPYLEAYGGEYFPFVLIGIAFSGYLSSGLSSFANAIRNEQITGTLEAILLTPTRLSIMLVSQALWKFLLATADIFLYLIIGILIFKVNLKLNELSAALIILILTLTSSGSLGIISAAVIMIFKKGDPVTWVFLTASSLLGGVYYPVAVLPDFLQDIAMFLPITHTLNGLRGALLAGSSFSDLVPHIGALALFTAVFLPVGVMTFSYAVRKAKKEGSLVHY
ncbi:MAG: ABC transporter permease [Nitrospiraceae bacterium]|nr:MAG: ABC transporter permease [Nitrospiraceae bacterium]